MDLRCSAPQTGRRMRGRLGSAADYLFQTVDCLRSNGVQDARLFALAEQVARLQAPAVP